jgi:hypothetical protein
VQFAGAVVLVDDFLVQNFLGRVSGVRGMDFDATRRKLYLPEGTAIRTSFDHRLMVEVFSFA